MNTKMWTDEPETSHFPSILCEMTEKLRNYLWKWHPTEMKRWRRGEEMGSGKNGWEWPRQLFLMSSAQKLRLSCYCGCCCRTQTWIRWFCLVWRWTYAVCRLRCCDIPFHWKWNVAENMVVFWSNEPIQIASCHMSMMNESKWLLSGEREIDEHKSFRW